MPGRRQPRTALGRCINRLVHHLAAKVYDDDIGAIKAIADYTGYGSDLVYRWIQGTRTPQHAAIEHLARMGAAHLLDRSWGEQLFSSSRYLNPADILEQ